MSSQRLVLVNKKPVRPFIPPGGTHDLSKMPLLIPIA